MRRSLLSRRKFRWVSGPRWLAVVLIVGFVGMASWRLFFLPRKLIGGRVNLALEKPLGMASFDLDDGSLTLFLVPPDAQVWLPYGLGFYRAIAVPALGKQEKKGLDLWAQGIMWTIGVGVDGWVGKGGNGVVGFEFDDGGKIRKVPIRERVLALLWGSETSLGLRDRYSLFRLTGRLGEDQIKLVDLGKSGVATRMQLPDGESALALDQRRVQGAMWPILRDKAVVDEGFTLAVLNGTNYANLASRVSSVIRGVGGRVVEEGAAGQFNEKCVIEGERNLRHSLTVRKLVSWFGCDFAAAEGGDRSEIKLILGEKFARLVEGS